MSYCVLILLLKRVCCQIIVWGWKIFLAIALCEIYFHLSKPLKTNAMTTPHHTTPHHTEAVAGWLLFL